MEDQAPADDQKDVPHVVLLLDAAQGITRAGRSISRWADQSGNGNDAIAGADAPTPSFAEQAIHGLPAVHFEGGSWMSIADALTLQFGDGNFAVEVVARHDRAAAGLASGYGVTTGYGMLYGKTEVPTPYAGVALFVNYPLPTPSTKLGVQTSYSHYALSTQNGLNDGKPHLFGARRERGTLEARVDGVAQGRVPAPDDVSAVGRPAFIGGHPMAGGWIIQQLKGDIAEIVVVRGGTTPEVFAALEAEVMAKFGL
jgi:hypothetical protein